MATSNNMSYAHDLSRKKPTNLLLAKANNNIGDNMIRRYLFAIIISMTSTLTIANQADEQKYFEKVAIKIKDNCQVARNYMQCRADNSPGKCKSLAFNEDLGSWSRCVRSCGSASFVSKSIGECS